MRPQLYIDHHALTTCDEWESVIDEAVDTLAASRKWPLFKEVSKRYFYVGRDQERGRLWSDEYQRENLNEKPTGSLVLRSSRGRGAQKKKPPTYSQQDS